MDNGLMFELLLEIPSLLLKSNPIATTFRILPSSPYMCYIKNSSLLPLATTIDLISCIYNIIIIQHVFPFSQDNIAYAYESSTKKWCFV